MGIRNSKATLKGLEKMGLEMSGNIFRHLDVIRNPTLLSSRNACCTRGGALGTKEGKKALRIFTYLRPQLDMLHFNVSLGMLNVC